MITAEALSNIHFHCRYVSRGYDHKALIITIHMLVFLFPVSQMDTPYVFGPWPSVFANPSHDLTSSKYYLL